MLKNYFKIAWRNLTRNKFSSFINISGLAVGITVALVNGLWVWDELSFNKYHENYDRIAKVTYRGFDSEGKPFANSWMQYPMADALKNGYGHYFDHILLSAEVDDYILKIGETKLTRKGQFIEAGAPDMLGLKMLKGTRAGLKEQASVIFSASAAKSIFGNTDPIGKVVTINAKMDVKVTGVYEDLPHNSEFYGINFFSSFDLLASTNSWKEKRGWDNYFLNVYVQLKPGLDFAQVSAAIKNVALDKIKNLPNIDKEQLKRYAWLLPMSMWHLRSDLASNDAVQMLWMIGLIGFFVLLLACINFMNLSTARSERRAKEVGIRKTIGSLRSQLIRQFFSESFLVVLFAFVFAIGLVAVFLPGFNRIADKQVSLPLSNIYFWIASLCCILFTALVAGSYPALYLSSFKPVKVLKGTFRAGRFASVPRKVLVVLQFTVSVTLIITTIVITQQIQHAKNRPIGYNKNNLLLVEKVTGDFYGKYELLRSELKNTGVVEEMAESRSSTTGITMWNRGFSIQGKEVNLTDGCGTLTVTSEYGKTVGWDFLQGRDFSRELTSDSSAFVVNESFAKLTGMQNPVGQTMVWAPGWRDPKPFTIIGVVRDMVAISPYEAATPTVFFIEDKYRTWINIRLKAGIGVSTALTKVGEVFKKLTPSAPFEYKFADEEYALKFAAEERISKLAVLFATLAIFISCLGLFGLASFIAEQRTKEIGIRRVVGASVFNLWKLLSRDFVVLTILSCVIAAPIAYYFLNQWLQNYHYHTEIKWWFFVVASSGVFVITLLTVSFQAIKAAIANPVKSLRTE